MASNWSKGIASWTFGGKLCISVVFSWDIPKAIELAKKSKCKVLFGGPAALQNRAKLLKYGEVENFYAPVEPVLFHNPFASFSSRGCPNKCKFCTVPGIEGGIKELKSFRPAPIMCDNNFLATSRYHQKIVVEELKRFSFVDFNQGLDARLFTLAIADRMGKLKLHARFAFDHIGMESVVADAIKLCRKRTTKKVSVYVLIGYKDTPEDALYRMREVRKWKALPNPMRYQPLNAKKRNCYVDPNWTDRELKHMTRYWSRLKWLSPVPYEEYKARMDAK